MTPEQKSDFYRRSAGDVKQAIEGYTNSPNRKAASPEAGYGSMGLNKMVNQISRGTENITEAARKTSQVLKSSLDDFLSDDQGVDPGSDDDVFDDTLLEKAARRAPSRGAARDEDLVDRYERQAAHTQTDRHAPPEPRHAQREPQQEVRAALSNISKEVVNELRQEIRTQQHKIDILEKKIFELAQNAQVGQVQNDAKGLYQLRTTLKALDIDESVVIDIVRKAAYELSKDELENPDIVFEFALKEMTNAVHTAHPLFSTIESDEPVITVLLSEAASGQTCMSMKIAVLKKDVELIQYSGDGSSTSSADFAAQVFGLKTHKAQQPAEIIQLCRKAIESGKSALVDLRLANKQLDETKKFIESLRRGLPHVEVLVSLSAIHSELYNRKILSRYKELADGLIISHVDLCLNFGALFNVHRAHNKIPLKFFGTGPVVPDDIESATAERIMAGLFQLS